MRVTWIDVGYGDAVLLQADNGYTMLLDGGSNLPQEFAGDAFRIRSADYLQQLGIRHIDAVIISHIHEDHVCGLVPVLGRIAVDAFYVPYPVEPFLAGHDLQPEANAARSVPLYTNALNDYRRILIKAKATDKPVFVVKPGDVIQLTEGLTVRVLGPKSQNIEKYMKLVQRAYDCQDKEEVTSLLAQLDATSNATSMLLKIEADDTAFLMAADYCPREWDEVPISLLKNVNVLKLPHHGQIDSVDRELMANMPLQYVVTTASSDRRYNSANVAVYETLCAIRPKDQPPRFLFTDEREYPPYFSQPDGFHAIILEKESGVLTAKFSG